MSRQQIVSIECGGDHLIGAVVGQASYGLHDFFGRLAGVLTTVPAW
jgi:hypothetical protein